LGVSPRGHVLGPGRLGTPTPISSHTTINAREKFLAGVDNPTIQSLYYGVSPIAFSTNSQSDNRQLLEGDERVGSKPKR